MMGMLNIRNPQWLNLDQQALSIYTEVMEKDLMDTLNMLELNIKEIKRLIEKNCEIDEIIFQISVSKVSLSHVACLLFSETVKKCINDQIEKGNMEEFDKLIVTIGRILKI